MVLLPGNGRMDEGDGSVSTSYAEPEVAGWQKKKKNQKRKMVKLSQNNLIQCQVMFFTWWGQRWAETLVRIGMRSLFYTGVVARWARTTGQRHKTRGRFTVGSRHQIQSWRKRRRRRTDQMRDIVMMFAYLHGETKLLQIQLKNLWRKQILTGVRAPLLLADPHPDVVGSE